MKPFSELYVWRDDKARSAAQNMAVDQILLERGAEVPLLRFYGWSEPAVSFGYFGCYSEALAYYVPSGSEGRNEKLVFVRRWTGGGMVDHRLDRTYTLTLPKGHPIEQLRGAESYKIIHKALFSSGLGTGLSDGFSSSGSCACFINPVAYDVLGAEGQKLAGAGQRRSKHGLIHQGSVLRTELSSSAEGEGSDWQDDFVQALAESSVQVEPEICEEEVADVARSRYASEAWLKKR